METKKIEANDLVVGSKVLSVKTGEVFSVDEVGPKITIVNEVEEFKTLSLSTLQRWYKLVLTEKVEEVEKLGEVEEVIEESVKPMDVSRVVQDTPGYVVEETVVPVQPAQPKQTKRHAPNAQQQDPVISALRQRLIDEVLSNCPSATVRETASYTAMRVGKFNFAEVYKGKRRFTFRVISEALTADQLANCAVAPESYGWTLDATFAVLSEADFNLALDILKAGYAYRAKNTPERGFKQSK